MPHDERACNGSPLHCVACGEDEQLEFYRRCFECGHRYATAADLLREHNLIIDRLGLESHESDPDRVWTCPMCIHDF